MPPAEPIAVIGMACRFPGAPDIPSFWRLLEAGGNSVIEGIPGSGVGRVGELFPDASVRTEACRFGAYLEGLDRFDAAFFRISPVEAQLLDPQQRLMLEVSWQALEDAGIAPERLRGSRTGVYAGISNYDYRGLILEAQDPSEPAASLYAVTGTSFNTAIGRVAFALGLTGPAMAVDTACSSSLVATHQAVSGLQRREADLALAGGVHTILSGRLSEFRGRAGMLSPDGQCKAFDASANGYVRGEGCGILVLKRLREAEADGDRIWGVIHGSAVNQDGASPGLTVPNEASQKQVIEDALARAGVRPEEVDYLEAHGTGTEVGDPVEIRAAAAAYGKGRETDRPLLIGSVKTNVGHLEPAAGAAGLIKTLLAMQRGVIPKHLHFRTPNPNLDWDRLPLRVTSQPTEWPLHPDRRRLAGVSGFGWSGTNAHIVVRGYEPPRDVSGDRPDPWPAAPARALAVSLPTSVGGKPDPRGFAARETRFLPLSGKSDIALQELADRYLGWLDEHAGDLSSRDAERSLLADMAWTAGTGRNHFRQRAGVVFRDAASLRARLARLAEADDDYATGFAEEAAPKTAFVFTGQASQWVGMGEDLYASEPVVRAVLDHCDRQLREERGQSLLDAMFGRGLRPPDLDDPVWKQPAIYALECSLTALWSSLGIRPKVVLGHSLGEIAAAQAAGVLSLEDGLRFAAVRGELIAALPGEGAMAAVFAPARAVAAAVERHNRGAQGPGLLSLAADNGTHQVVSGLAGEVEKILARFEREEVRVRRLRKSPAYHSAMLDPALDALETALDELPVAPPSLSFVSSLTGRVVGDDQALDGTYWRRQSREPVEFRRAVETLAELGVRAVVEIGPHAVLGPMVSMAWPEPSDGNGRPAVPAVLSSLRRPSREAPEDAVEGFARAVARAYEIGLPVSFPALFTGESRRRISLPGYPFQRERHWIERTKRRRPRDSHPLLGTRHESASGEISFETEVARDDPPWLDDHRVFERLVAPGALYGVMVVSAVTSGKAGSLEIANFQLHNPLILSERDSEDGSESVRKIQVVLDGSASGAGRRVRVLSRGGPQEEWTLHAEASATPEAPEPDPTPGPDPGTIRTRLVREDVAAYYRTKAGVGIGLGASFRTLEALWAGPGEALGEVALPSGTDRAGLEVHPLLLDGCFQVMAAARRAESGETGATYLPFAWDRLWFAGPWPDRVVCHVRLRESDPDGGGGTTGDAAEVLTADLRILDRRGTLVGAVSGYSVKRATRAALLSTAEELDELLYEIEWRDQALPPGILPADFLPTPAEVAARSPVFRTYLAAEGVEAEEEAKLQTELERLACSCALSTLEKLGWARSAGTPVDAGSLRRRLRVLPEHEQLFARILELLAKAGVLREAGERLVVAAGSDDPLPEGLPADTVEYATRLAGLYPHGSNEIALFSRCAGALPEVLRGRRDPLSLLFGDQEPTAGDLYMRAPVWRAANRMLGEVVERIVAGLPDGRPLRVIEVGAGIGSATDRILPKLPEGRFDYTYTDISAGFFADAESRFSDGDTRIEYRVLDIEKDPVAQGFEHHGYDLAIAANVLHATRYLDETLTHCRELLAPSGHLIALENQRGRGWMDLIFGQLDGWWRFHDAYRPRHALAGPEVWRRALRDAGFEAAEIVGVDESESAGVPDRGVIVATGPAEVTPRRGVWVVAADRGGMGVELAAELAARNQTVLLAEGKPPTTGPAEDSTTGVVRKSVELHRREAWRSLFSDLAGDIPLAGIAHLAGLDGRGSRATTEEMAADVRHGAASALALIQGLADADATPSKGVWFVTRGAQVLGRERTGELAGAPLWGFGRVVAREAGHLQPRMIDLEPAAASSGDLAEELLFPDRETDIAYRGKRRLVARLVRSGSPARRLSLPEGSDWQLAPDPSGALDKLRVQPRPPRFLAPREVRVAVEAGGLNFLDVFRAMGLVQGGLLGEEICGRVVEVGSGVSSVSAGDRVVGLAFGALGPEVVTREELVALAPSGFPAAALATVPEVFVTAALSWELARLKAGERVLVHAGAGGVGLAAIQLAQVAGAEVLATASAPKRPYLRSLGVEHVFDSRRTTFSKDVLDATGGAGVEVVLNSLTGEGFIEASLACLADGGRFVELARRDILSEEDMVAVRPDVAYSILELDVLKEKEPGRPGRALREVMGRIAAGELTPLVHTRWPLAETGAAMAFMRDARHIGKIVLTAPPLREGRLRPDRTYLVTGGLGGIGCAVAHWLADHGARTIVLNGRRAPDPVAGETIAALDEHGVTVRVELADVTDAEAVDGMLARVDRELPPLAGVIHSVGALADAALTNQSWENFETVLWPKVLGAWQLHRATRDRDLEMFVLFSSVAGVLGNPGQSNHAAANAFLDQLAAHRRSLGLPGQAIAWGAWSEIGEAEEQRERIARRTEATGIEWITPEQGLRAFEHLVREDIATSLVLARDWSVFEQPGEARPPLLGDLLAREEAEDAPTATEDLLTRLRQAPSAEHEPLLASFLREQLQAVLRLPAPPAAKVGFFDLGMDSLMAVEFRNRLNRALSGKYTAPNTVVFDYPNIEALGGHLARELAEIGGASPPTAEPAPEPQPVKTPASQGDAIAIVGMACRFPGAADLDAFWCQLEAGGHAVTEGRQDPGSGNRVREGPAGADGGSRWGAFVEGIDRFDASFFGVLPIGARLMDPQQRLLLETSWHALEDASMDPDRLRGGRVGVYAGIGTSEYRELMGSAREGVNYLGTLSSMAVGGVALRLGLTGPTMPVLLNCASSLVAVHHAVAALRQGEVDLVLTGGVNTVFSRGVTEEMAALGMLSPTGKCATFDAAADGFVRGEGCGMIVLKRLRDAVADGDRIWGVVRGTAVNQNGATAGPTVPNGPAQERVIEEALARAGLSATEVDYLEAHGAASEMGDPIEVQAAAAVYGRERDTDRPLLIGSVKTNIGHLEPAAGIAGLIKTVLAMNRRVVPKHLHFRNPMPHLDWDRLPVQVAAETTDWPVLEQRPPRAGISAFGVSGVNAHVVLEGFETADRSDAGAEGSRWPAGSSRPVAVPLPTGLPDPLADEPAAPRKTRFLPLSGKSEAALRDLAGRYLGWLEELSDGPRSGSELESLLSDLAWTAGIGRSHFGHRAGVVFRDRESLREGLRALADHDGQRAAETAGEVTPKVAFAFPGHVGDQLAMSEQLYESESVARAVLDRCDEVFREDCGESLLEGLFGRARTAADAADPTWRGPAIYALQCALVTLWAGVGVRPQAAVGWGIGELAAARAAGVFGLEDGLRLAAWSASADGPDGAVRGTPPGELELAPPSVTLISPTTGRALSAGEVTNAGYWRRRNRTAAGRECSAVLSALDAQLTLEMDAGGSAGFAAMVAEAYEAGVHIDFAGLFAGETRRRISLPGYPFQRRRFWISEPQLQV